MKKVTVEYTSRRSARFDDTADATCRDQAGIG